jgi:hypothetical protein
LKHALISLKMSMAARCRLLIEIERQTRYAYLATLVGVVLAAIATTYTTISPFLFGQASRRPTSVTPGNFTGPSQFGNFTGAPQLGNMNPGGFANNFAILAVIIAVVGVLWLGLSLRKSHLKSHEGEDASARDKPKTESTTCARRCGFEGGSQPPGG